VNSERLAWIVTNLNEVLEVSLVLGTFLSLLIAATIVCLQRRPSLITENVTLRRHGATQPQGVTEVTRQLVASLPAHQPGRASGEGSWSTQVLNYLQSHPGLVGVTTNASTLRAHPRSQAMFTTSAAAGDRASSRCA
jgi:hypothetical protein